LKAEPKPRDDPERWELAAPNLETILARLDMVSGAPIPAYNPSGGASSEDPGGKLPAGDNASPAAPFRRRLATAEHGYALRLASAGEDEAAIDRAYASLRSARAGILHAAQRELESLTGRDGVIPRHHTAELDSAEGIADAVADEARGKPAKLVAERLGLTVFQVARVYVDLGLDPRDGTPRIASPESPIERAARYAAEGKTQKQIAALLRLSQPTVSRLLRSAA
jgi:hypothetical protein